MSTNSYLLIKADNVLVQNARRDFYIDRGESSIRSYKTPSITRSSMERLAALSRRSNAFSTLTFDPFNHFFFSLMTWGR